jgi:hypothetical protein
VGVINLPRAELKVISKVLLVAADVALIDTVSGAMTGSRFRAASTAVPSLLPFRGPVKIKTNQKSYYQFNFKFRLHNCLQIFLFGLKTDTNMSCFSYNYSNICSVYMCNNLYCNQCHF